MDPGSFLNLDALPFPFCPGCGHGFILPRIDEALQLVEADPAKVVIVTDIGCVGLSDPYFRVHTLHGLHGRAVTYATGIKLARPDLHVLVLMGDGGMGIGGTHLLSAARRNIGITVLVFNNANFGMTGGQHSVTTPEEARTATTPLGNLETPLDICATLAPARPNFLARTHAYDPGLPRLIADGLSCNGFALLDIQEYCTAYFVCRNLSESEGLISLPASEGAVEVVHRDARPEFSRAYRARYHGAPEMEAAIVSGSAKGNRPVASTTPVSTSHFRNHPGRRGGAEGPVRRLPPRPGGDPLLPLRHAEGRLPDHHHDRPFGFGDPPQPGPHRLHGDRRAGYPDPPLRRGAEAGEATDPDHAFGFLDLRR
ncbi:MAG: hypothetical protein HY760_09230 [Nitrospirae bacterium]|nr:hypothetical protein [Nitrospirota bacterium]